MLAWSARPSETGTPRVLDKTGSDDLEGTQVYSDRGSSLCGVLDPGLPDLDFNSNGVEVPSVRGGEKR